jgi:hypothetical protein
LFKLQSRVLCYVAAPKKRFVHSRLQVLIKRYVGRANDEGRYVKWNTVPKGMAKALKIRQPRVSLVEVGLHFRGERSSDLLFITGQPNSPIWKRLPVRLPCGATIRMRIPRQSG